MDKAADLTEELSVPTGALTGAHAQPARCVGLPSNLTLCASMGYTMMRPPNLVEQWSVDEAIVGANACNQRTVDAWP